MSQPSYFVGVDVGSGSARAALVTDAGSVLRTHVSEIRTWRPLPDHYEQSSEDIWRAVCECVRSVCGDTDPQHISGIGFDATCSLVALDSAAQPCSLSTTGRHEQNIIVWMDHRAAAETEHINRTAHPILRYVGGAVSLEMQAPKLLWCKRHLPESFGRAAWFLDLPDYLTFRSVGGDSRTPRSLCSAVCKWNYAAGDGGQLTAGEWPADYFEAIGLGELMAAAAGRIGRTVVAPGTALARGLCEQAAADLGLAVGTAVGASMIDAHAGALALFGSSAEADDDDDAMDTKMVIIAGTSSCHMSLVRQPISMPGIWGPYRGALFADSYLHEAGQSATGLLLDHVCRRHPAYAQLLQLAGSTHPHVFLNRHLEAMRPEGGVAMHELTKHLHVWPDYHGNRSPVADATLRGSVSGLSMAADVDDLAVLYLAHVQALAYGTRHILAVLRSAGRPPFTGLCIGGGLAKNALFIRTHADVCQLPVLVARQPEAMLLGAAMLGACAAGRYATLSLASRQMAGGADRWQPDRGASDYHERKYAVFQRMLRDQRAYAEIMRQ